MTRRRVEPFDWSGFLRGYRPARRYIPHPTRPGEVLDCHRWVSRRWEDLRALASWARCRIRNHHDGEYFNVLGWCGTCGAERPGAPRGADAVLALVEEILRKEGR